MRYCPNCGQENIEPKESAWHLIVHFFNDVTHFDGKFFTSIKYLLTKPGFLTEEYVKGKRASYLNPIRMYLFISALFFLLLMSVFKERRDIIKETKTDRKDTSIAKKGLSKISAGLDSIDKALEEEDNKIKFSVAGSGEQVVINNDDRDYKTVHEYDSVQKALPAAERDGFIARYFTRRTIASQAYYKTDPEGMKRMFWGNYYHSMPYMLFISLPLIALLFKLFYIRRKQFYYVSHGIFTIHFYCFVFIALILLNTLEMFGDGWVKLVRVALQLLGFIYLYLAMLRFYKQGKFKTFVKFVLIFFIGSTMIGILLLLFIINSFLNVGGAH